MTRGPLRWRSALLPLSVALLTFTLTTGVSDATYTGAVQLTTLDEAAAGAGWIVVPEFDQQSDPGTITGTPFSSTFASLQVAHLAGPKRIEFRPYSGALATATDAPLAAGSARKVVVAWTTGTQIETATLGPNGAPGRSVATPGNPIGDSQLTIGPDGAYGIQWSDGAGGHAEVVPPGGDAFEPVLAGGGVIPSGDSVLLAGGDAAWLVGRDATGVGVAAITLGQSAPPPLDPVLPGLATTTLVDGRGNLWVLARYRRRWLVSRAKRARPPRWFALQPRARSAVMALAPGRALLAYRGPDCHTFLQALAVDAQELGPSLDLTPGARGCSTPTAVAADPATGTAYVLVRSGRGLRLVVARRRAVSTSPTLLTGRAVALQPAGLNRVLVETEGPERDLGPQCGGADDSFSTTDTFRVFAGARLERAGSLSAQELHC